MEMVAKLNAMTERVNGNIVGKKKGRKKLSKEMAQKAREENEALKARIAKKED